MLRSDHRELRNKIENEIDVVDVFSDWFLSAASYPSLRQCWWRRYWWPGWTRRGSLSLREQAVDADSGGCLLISSYLIQVVFFSFLSLLPLVKNPTLTMKCTKLNRNRLHKKKTCLTCQMKPLRAFEKKHPKTGSSVCIDKFEHLFVNWYYEAGQLPSRPYPSTRSPSFSGYSGSHSLPYALVSHAGSGLPTRWCQVGNSQVPML